MNVAAILALLLSSGVCGKADFRGGDGGTLRVIVCPIMQPPGDKPDAPDAAPGPGAGAAPAPAKPPAGVPPTPGNMPMRTGDRPGDERT